MGLIQQFIQNLPVYLLSLPVILIALSVHESAHGFVAYKLGDPTARNLGRITLNPVKHLDLFGFLSMLFFHIGWAKPVPIMARNFKKPRRDMAISGAAGPVSNLLLAVISMILLRLALSLTWMAIENGSTFLESEMAFTVMALVVYLLLLGVIMNLSLTVFNLIPIPPFDGSRIFYAFLPSKWYFGVMKYEQYIMIGFFVLFVLGVLDTPLGIAQDWLLNGLLTIGGIGNGTKELGLLSIFMQHVDNLLAA